jgi:hypothetical protein
MPYKFSSLEMLAEWFRLPPKLRLASRKKTGETPEIQPRDITQDEATAFENKQQEGPKRPSSSGKPRLLKKSDLPHSE